VAGCLYSHRFLGVCTWVNRPCHQGNDSPPSTGHSGE
jgi:hypothetical protein